jgi:hypothetical protein
LFKDKKNYINVLFFIQKVILLCHSMGSPMMLYLLNQKTDSWKEKYIRAFITLAGVWGGTVRALKVYLLGEFLCHEDLNIEMNAFLYNSATKLNDTDEANDLAGLLAYYLAL